MQPISELKLEELTNLKILFFDFDGVFTDNFVYTSEIGEEYVKCSRLDGMGLGKIKKIDLMPIIISSEKNQVVTVRAKKLGVCCYQSIEDKAAKIKEICREFGVRPKDQLFLGNDENDIPAFELVGINVAVNDFYPGIAQHVKYKTKNRGGHGAVRELCEIVYSLLSKGLADV